MIIQFDSGARQRVRPLVSHSRDIPMRLRPSHSLQTACALRLALRIIQFDYGVQKNLWRSAKLSAVTKIASHPSHSPLMGLAWCQARRTRQFRLWDVSTCSQIGAPLLGHEWAVETVVFSPGGKFIISGSSDNTIRIWDATTGALIREPLRGHSKSVYCITFSPDGTRFASG